MSNIALLQARPPHVRFENVEQEDRTASIDVGYYVAKQVPFAVITPIGSRDTVFIEADQYIKSLRNGNTPAEWYNHFKLAFEEWKEGNEMPEFGTPVMTFLGFSPAQRSQLLAHGVRTLEDCAEMNEEALSKVGMGARELKEKAKLAMSSANTLAAEIEVLRVSNDALAQRNSDLDETIKELQVQIKQLANKK